MKRLDRSFWAVFLAIAIIGTITWLAIFEHNYHPRIYRYSEDVIILQLGGSELDFNHPERAFSIWWQSGRRTQAFGLDLRHRAYPSDDTVPQAAVPAVSLNVHPAFAAIRR